MPSSAPRRSKISRPLIISGSVLIAFSLFVLVFTFFPVLVEEAKYRTYGSNRTDRTYDATPVDTEFGLVIPKIRANAKVIPDVDPFDPKAYQAALTRGVAHAKGSRFFIFSHSSVNFYEAARYNSIFYLLNKLESGDEIFLYYKGEKRRYLVSKKEVVAPEAVSYLSGGDGRTLVLMTCTPPGTTISRLIVEAQLTI